MNTLEYANIDEVEMVLLNDAELIDLQDDTLYGDNEDIYAIGDDGLICQADY